MSVSHSDRLTWFAHTKLHPPRTRADVVWRPRLIDRLRVAVTNYPLTLLSAPAGAGKTTLLAALSQACPDLPTAWLSLDEDDNDPARFLYAIVAALQRLHPSCGATALSLLETLTTPGAAIRRVVGVLINEILATFPAPFVLVLDDLHVLNEPVIHAALDHLIERMPSQLHVVIATRHDPPLSLPRLRARREVVELRLQDLRFTLDETEQFFNLTLGLGLSAAHLAILHDRTEGWAAGIGLLASSLDRIAAPEDRQSFLAHLARTDRYVFDFLAEEVLNRQDPFVRMFLLETAILPDLTPEACQSVTGRADAPAILDELYRRNLFLVRLEREDSGAAYRYHDLFAAFLRERLRCELPEWRRELHRRAAQAEPTPTRRMHHYVAAELWQAAAQMIEQMGEQLLQQGAVAILRTWIRALPQQLRSQRPRLTYLLGVCAWETYELDVAQTLLEQACRDFAALGDWAGQSAARLHLALCLTTVGDFEGARAVTQHMLDGPSPPQRREPFLIGRAWQELARGAWRQAATDLDEALSLIESSGDVRALHIVAAHFHIPFAALPDGVARAEWFCRLAAGQLNGPASPLQAAVYSLMASAHVWRGRWDDAKAVGQRALAINDQLGGMLWINANVGALLPVCYALEGNASIADRYFDALFSALAQPAAIAFAGAWEALYLYLLGRVRWLQGRVEEARAVYTRMRAIESPREWPIAPVVRTMMQGLLALAEGAYPEAERLLRHALLLQQQLRFSTIAGSAALLLAHLYYLWDRPKDALAVLAPVLDEHERQGSPGFIMWEGASVVVPLLRLALARNLHSAFAAQVLSALGAAPQARSVDAVSMRVPDTGEVLTPRELEVLRLIALGASNPAIAERLVISIHTVKIHVAHILPKLNVTSRFAAAVRARELGLV